MSNSVAWLRATQCEWLRRIKLTGTAHGRWAMFGCEVVGTQIIGGDSYLYYLAADRLDGEGEFTRDHYGGEQVRKQKPDQRTLHEDAFTHEAVLYWREYVAQHPDCEWGQRVPFFAPVPKPTPEPELVPEPQRALWRRVLGVK